MLLELLTLAQTATPPDDQVSTKVLYGVISAIFTGLALLLGKTMGKREARATRLEEPVPTLPVLKIQGPVSWYQHEGLERRVGVLEVDLKKVEEQQAAQYLSIIQAGHERETSIKDKIDGVAREWHARLDDQFGPRPVKRKPGGGQ